MGVALVDGVLYFALQSLDLNLTAFEVSCHNKTTNDGVITIKVYFNDMLAL